MRIVFLGPPGSGKGSQAKLLAEKVRIPHVALGDILRSEIRSGSEIGKEIKEILAKGNLAPNHLVNAVARKRLKEKDCRVGVILDGYPRTIAQAEALEEIFAEDSFALDRIIYLNADLSEIVKRLGGRWSCKNCGQVYNANNNPPQVEGKCDRCQGELYQRADDRPEAVKNRFTVYEEKTKPLVEHYRKEKKLVEVDGSGRYDEVFKRICSVLAL